LPLFKLGLGGRFGSGAQWWSWITLDDEIRAIEWLLENDVGGPVNLTAPNPVTNKEFSRVLGAVLFRPARLPVPRFGPSLLLGSELADALLFTSARVRPEVLESSGFEFSHSDLESGLRSLLRPPAS
jgi:NAD dependent epimerase/dehydratase family enzyme